MQLYHKLETVAEIIMACNVYNLCNKQIIL